MVWGRLVLSSVDLSTELIYSHPDYDVALQWERDYFNRLLQQ